MKVILIHPKTGAEFTFDKDHAARLMGMPNNGGWKKKQHAATNKRNKRKAKKSEAKEPNQSSD